MNSQENDQLAQPDLPIFRRRKSATLLMPLFIGTEDQPSSPNNLGTDDLPGTASLELGPLSPFKSPTMTLSPNLIFERHRRLSTSSRSSFGAAGSGLGSSSDSISNSKSPSPTTYRFRRCSSTNQLDTLPTETLEDRIGRWMLWASEAEKRFYEDASKSKKTILLHEDMVSGNGVTYDEKENMNGENYLEVTLNFDHLAACSPLESPFTPVFTFFSEDNMESSCKLFF